MPGEGKGATVDLAFNILLLYIARLLYRSLCVYEVSLGVLFASTVV